MLHFFIHKKIFKMQDKMALIQKSLHLTKHPFFTGWKSLHTALSNQHQTGCTFNSSGLVLGHTIERTGKDPLLKSCPLCPLLSHSQSQSLEAGQFGVAMKKLLKMGVKRGVLQVPRQLWNNKKKIRTNKIKRQEKNWKQQHTVDYTFFQR